MWGFVDCSRYFMKFGMPKIVLDNASMAVASNAIWTQTSFAVCF